MCAVCCCSFVDRFERLLQRAISQNKDVSVRVHTLGTGIALSALMQHGSLPCLIMPQAWPG